MSGTHPIAATALFTLAAAAGAVDIDDLRLGVGTAPYLDVVSTSYNLNEATVFEENQRVENRKFALEVRGGYAFGTADPIGLVVVPGLVYTAREFRVDYSAVGQTQVLGMQLYGAELATGIAMAMGSALHAELTGFLGGGGGNVDHYSQDMNNLERQIRAGQAWYYEGGARAGLFLTTDSGWQYGGQADWRLGRIHAGFTDSGALGRVRDDNIFRYNGVSISLQLGHRF